MGMCFSLWKLQVSHFLLPSKFLRFGEGNFSFFLFFFLFWRGVISSKLVFISEVSPMENVAMLLNCTKYIDDIYVLLLET